MDMPLAQERNEACKGQSGSAPDKYQFRRDFMLMRKKRLAVFSMVLIMSMMTAVTSYADIVTGRDGGPGIGLQTGTQTGTDTSTAGTEGQQASDTQAQTQPAASGVSSRNGVVTGVSPYVDPSTIQQAGPGYTPPNTSNMSMFTEELLNASLGPDNTDLSLTAEAGSVGPDPVLGETPELHAQLITPDYQLSVFGFTTNMDFFPSPQDGMLGLKMRIGIGIGDVFYRVYTDEHGWTTWAMNEMKTPTYDDPAKVTAIQIRTNGYIRNLYDVYYRVTLNDGTVLDWAHDGQTAGTIGTGKYVQAVQMKLWKKDTKFFQPTAQHMVAANYEGIKFDASGRAFYSTASGTPYTGWAYDTAGNKYYFMNSNIVTGWQYIDGYKYYFDSNGIVVTDLEPIMGLTGDYIIKLNKEMKTLTVYTKDGANGYIIPYKVFLTTIGPDTPLGTYNTYVKYRWKFMHDNIYCQYLARFYQGFLMHSLIYFDKPDSYHFDAGSYNYHGKRSSDGCVRLTAGDAAWLYNNCPTGTSITIYEDYWVMGPFDRPAIEWAIPANQNYDPTDPVVNGTGA